MLFSELELHNSIYNNIKKIGHTELTEIQKLTFKPYKKGEILEQFHRPGTGKTFAFLIPILDKLLKEKHQKPAVLILCPTVNCVCK